MVGAPMAATDPTSDTATEPEHSDARPPRGAHGGTGRTLPWWPRWLHPGVLLLILVSYVPLLLTRPGQVGADTKTYLYLDPARLLSRAPFMWDPNVGLGTVTHQNIGYLWPMGPYYWVMETIGLPDWVAQRLWLGSIILAAGLGVRWMLQELRWSASGATVAAFAYALSPYLIDYGARISVILLPFAGLPWLIGLSARSLRRRDWTTPAIFALVTLTVGGVNATSLLLVMIGPLMWFVYATFVEREVRVGQALATALRIGVLTLVTSLWWMAGLAIQGGHGISILRYTETYETVANASLAPELVRGLGYWFFYGSDGLGAWTAASVGFVENAPLLVLSFLIPGLAIVAGLLTRWRHRVFFASMIVVGLVVAVGAHPFESPSPYGALFKAFTSGDLGLSFRSTPRAVPLIALGLAVFLGAGVGAFSRRRPSWHPWLAGGMIVLICLNQMPLFRGQMVDRNLLRDEEIPSYWVEAAEAMDAGDRDTRVLEVPGIDFASYRWGNTVDPITPGLTDRAYVARELIPYGSPPSANLLNDLDLPFQSGRVDPAAIAPLARLLGVGEIVLRADLQFERYRTPRPRQTFAELLAAPGLEAPVGFGDPLPNEASDQLPLDDEMSFAIPSSAQDPAPVSLFGVEDPRPVLRTTSALAPTVLAGNGAGIVALAAVGRLGADRPVFYSASFADDVEQLRSLVDEPDSELVVTDTNRRQARRWGAVRDNDGYTERIGEAPLVDDATDNRLEVFPDESDDHRTVVEQLGGTTAAASRYGNGVTYTGSDRAANAVDGDPRTAWRVAAFDDAVGEFIEIGLDEPLTTDHVDLLQVQGAKNRHITEVELSFDDGEPVVFPLDDSSRAGEGQRIDVGERTFSRLRITVRATDPGGRASYKGISDVGFAEIGLDGMAPVVEVVRPPVDLLDAVGPSSLDRPLTYLFTRRAAKPSDVIASDEEPTIRRWVIGPVDRRYTVYGTARLDVRLDDAALDAVLGRRRRGQRRSDRDLVGPAARLAHGAGLLSRRRRSRHVVHEPARRRCGNRARVHLPGAGHRRRPAARRAQRRTALGARGGQHLRRRRPGGAAPPRGRRARRGRAPRHHPHPHGAHRRADRHDLPHHRRLRGRGGVEGLVRRHTRRCCRSPSPRSVCRRCRRRRRTPRSTFRAAAISCRSTASPWRSAWSGPPVRPRRAIRSTCVGATTPPTGWRSRQARSCSRPTTTVASTSTCSRCRRPRVALPASTPSSPLSTRAPNPPRRPPSAPVATTTASRSAAPRIPTGSCSGRATVPVGRHAPPTASTWVSRPWSTATPTGGGVDPSEVGADATIEIRWTPQRIVWIGLGLSAVGVVACLALIVVGALRRRRPSATTEADTPDEAAARTPGAMVPTWISLRGGRRGRDAPRRSVIAALVAGVVATIAAGPFVGLSIAVVAGVGLGLRRGQFLLRLSCVVMAAASFGFIIAKQLRYRYEIDFDWMNSFELTHSWTMFAILALLVAVVVDRLRSGEDG